MDDLAVPFNGLILLFCVEKYGDVLVVDLATVLWVEIEGASFIFFARKSLRVCGWMKEVVDGAQDVDTLINSDCTKTRLIVEKMNDRLHGIYLTL